MATHVRKVIGNENAAPGAKPILKKSASTVMTLGPNKAGVFREPTLTARGPLGELGNKQLSLKTSSIPEPIPKKINVINGTLKDNLPVIRSKSAKENVPKPTQTIKPKQASIKPGLKRQESILLKLVKPLSNINVKEDKEKSSDVELKKAVIPTISSYSSKQLVDVIDVDVSDNDPHFVSTYVKDIMRYLLELEKRYAITEKYLLMTSSDGQKHNTTPKMRSVLINWMVEVHSSFGFLPETLHLSVAITDRYLQNMPNVGRKTLQLVGTIALYVAGKYEEMYIPEISEFVFMCDDVFSKDDMFRMEKDILNRMGFELGGPLSLHFLRRYNKIAKVEIDHHALGKYLIELALVDHRFCHVPPSLQAAAACFLALVTLGTNKTSPSSAGSASASSSRLLTTTNSSTNIAQHWTKTLAHYSTYSYSTITPYVHNLALLLNEAPNSSYQAVRSKYANSEHRKVSIMPALQSSIVKKLASMAKI